jgi:hypothetical protein
MTLQEYLVRLGWSVDEPSFKKFGAALASTTARTAELSSAVIETAAAVELMVARVAQKYETLYYVSQRTGQSVKYIQSTQFAFKQIGLSAEDASASIERMGATLRTQPWLRAIFGNASTPQEVAKNLGKSGLPYFLQARFAEMIGMDETTLLHLQKFAQVEEAMRATLTQRQREAGLDPEKLAVQSANFGRELNKLETDLEIFGDRIAADMIDPITRMLTKLDESVQWLNRVDNATKGWVGTLGTLAGTAGGLLVVEKIIRRLLGLGSKTATGAVVGLGARAAGGLSLGAGGWLAAVLGGLAVVKTNDPETKASLREMLGPIFYELGLSKSPDLTGGGGARRHHRIGKIGSGAATFPNVGAAKVAGYGRVSDRINQAVSMLVEAGFPLDSAQGIVSGLYAENTAMDPSKVNSIGMTGIAQWDTARRAKFKEQYLHEAGQGSFEEQMQFLIWEMNNTESATGDKLRKGGLGARGAAGAYIHGFERPGPAGEASDMSRAGPLADALSQLAAQQNNGNAGNVITLNSKTDVHVNASGPDVASTAKAYGAAHDQANENLIRNIQGVVR